MPATVYNLDEWRASHPPQMTLEQAAAESARQRGEFLTRITEYVSSIPTWAWGAAALVVVGILAARWSPK